MTGNKQKPPFYLIDTAHPFYRPLWLRIVIVAITLAWAGLEIVGRDMFFVVISAAIAVYCTWVLIIKYTPPEPAPIRPPDPEEDDEVVDEARKD